jgi:hypothetical protein
MINGTAMPLQITEKPSFNTTASTKALIFRTNTKSSYHAS